MNNGDNRKKKTGNSDNRTKTIGNSDNGKTTNMNDEIPTWVKRIIGSEHNDALSDLVKDKRVAIVGPSRSLMNEKLGASIDRYDVVVRINHGHRLTDNASDYGTKTNIIYLNQKYRRHYGAAFPKEWFSAGLKLINVLGEKYREGLETPCAFCLKDFTTGDEIDLLRTSEDYRVLHQHCYDQIHGHEFDYKDDCEVRRVHLYDYEDIVRFTFNPLTGFLAFLDILLHHPKELGVFGFDFYDKAKQNKDNETYGDGYYQISDNSVGVAGHNDQDGIQLRTFKKICEHSNDYKIKITMDRHLHRLIGG